MLTVGSPVPTGAESSTALTSQPSSHLSILFLEAAFELFLFLIHPLSPVSIHLSHFGTLFTFSLAIYLAVLEKYNILKGRLIVKLRF